MNLPIPTPAQIAEFKQIYLEEFGKELTPDEAWETATITLQLFWEPTDSRLPEYAFCGSRNFYLGTYGLKAKAPEVPNTLGETSRKRSSKSVERPGQTAQL